MSKIEDAINRVMENNGLSMSYTDMAQVISELVSEGSIKREEAPKAIKVASEMYANELAAELQATGLLHGVAEVCDECKNVIPENADSMVNKHHSDACSLSPKNVVGKKTVEDVVEEQGRRVDRDQILVAQIEQECPTYNGWQFEYVYDGYFAYHKACVSAFFTPDFNGKGFIDKQVQDEYGLPIDDDKLEGVRLDKVPYNEPLTLAQLFSAAKELMDDLDKLLAKNPKLGYNPDAHKE